MSLMKLRARSDETKRHSVETVATAIIPEHGELTEEPHATVLRTRRERVSVRGPTIPGREERGA
jgi:hypothetical protein